MSGGAFFVSWSQRFCNCVDCLPVESLCAAGGCLRPAPRRWPCEGPGVVLQRSFDCCGRSALECVWNDVAVCRSIQQRAQHLSVVCVAWFVCACRHRVPDPKRNEQQGVHCWRTVPRRHPKGGPCARGRGTPKRVFDHQRCVAAQICPARPSQRAASGLPRSASPCLSAVLSSLSLLYDLSRRPLLLPPPSCTCNKQLQNAVITRRHRRPTPGRKRGPTQLQCAYECRRMRRR